MRNIFWLSALLFGSVTLSCIATCGPLGPHITGNSSDNVLITWSGPVNGTLTIQTSMLPSGGSWGAPISVSNNTSMSIHPEVAINDNGDISFAWQQNVPGKQIMTAYASFGGSPSTPAQLTQNGGTIPAVALNDAGKAILVWHRAISSADGLGVASCPQLSTDCTVGCHSPSGSSPIYPSVAICQNSGDAMVVCQEYQNEGLSSVIKAVPIPSGDSWGTPVVISSADAFATNPAVIYGSTGEALVKWEVAIGNYMGVMVASYSGGNWGDTTTFSASDSNIFNADLAMSDGGTVILVAECTNSTSHSIVVAQRTDGSWSNLSTLSQDASESAHNPKISMSATGTSGIAAVVWEGRVSSTQQRIRASCLLPSSTWSTPVVISSNDTSVYSSNPAVWMSHAGAKAFAAWRSQASGSHRTPINSSTYSSSSQTWADPIVISTEN